LSGAFSYRSSTDGSGGNNSVSKMFIGGSNITGAANDGTTAVSLNGGSFGLVVYWNNLSKQSMGYALTATGTVSVLAGSGTATATVVRNTTSNVITETVQVGGSTIALNFDSTQTRDPSTGAPYQAVTIT